MADVNYYNKQQLPNQENPSKFYTHFFYKALLVLFFLVILPLFPSQAPEFLNQTLHTRGWELLHLLFVGIAVSYGLFSRRNDETEKEQSNSKFDNAHSMVSRFLQVSSVFDDESQTPSGSYENKVQTWSNKYYRNEPSVVVAQDHSVLSEQRGSSSRIGEKPLLLPVRSLKSRVSGSSFVESINESSGSLKSLSRSNSGSKRLSSSTSKPNIGELGRLDHVNLEQKLNDNVVLPSPIPWRSRSGRMEVKEEADSPLLQNPSMEEHEVNRVESRYLKPQSSRLSRSNSSSSSPKLSPKKLSPSLSLASESQANNADDLKKKKSFHISSPPPAPPPPPPPPSMHKSSSLKPSNASEPMLMGREDSGLEVKPRRSVNNPPIANSVRTIRSSDSPTKSTTYRDFEDKINGYEEGRSKEFEENLEGVEHSFRRYAEEEEEEFDDKVMVESDGESGSDNDINEASSYVSGNAGSSSNEEVAVSSNVSDGGPDVDKKADEFIAKFREQIRLQRINSIRRSSAEINTKNSSR